MTIQDIETFFQIERTETDQIEFKSIHPSGSLDDKFKGIHKSVCAMLNSSGGLIIWGAPIGQKVEGRKEKVFTGELTLFQEVLEKDFVISKISDSIIPLPSAIRIKILNKDSNSLVIIEVDKSEYSPHQTYDTYYMRIDGQSKPAPHHYIEALFKRIKYPNIEVLFKITGTDIHNDSLYRVDFDMYFFNWTPLQNEEDLSFRVLVDNGHFSNHQIPGHQHMYRLNGQEFYKDCTKEIFYFGEPVRESDIILFNPYKVEKNGNKANIIISFGGRFSPRKTSEYILDFSKFLSSKPNELIIERKENRLTKDVQDEKGVNKESIIKTLMEK
ncbi:MAG: ATP-binding protein [Cyclobacteriaceae bacterium]|nr:MAG: ATP-binding protein [Cyclobacteriaceae bacterium]